MQQNPIIFQILLNLPFISVFYRRNLTLDFKAVYTHTHRHTQTVKNMDSITNQT